MKINTEINNTQTPTESDNNVLSISSFLQIIASSIGLPHIKDCVLKQFMEITDYSEECSKITHPFHKIETTDYTTLRRIYNGERNISKSLASNIIPFINPNHFAKYLETISNNNAMLKQQLETKLGKWKYQAMQYDYWKYDYKEKYDPIFKICATLFSELIHIRSTGKKSIQLYITEPIAKPKKRCSKKHTKEAETPNEVSTETSADVSAETPADVSTETPGKIFTRVSDEGSDISTPITSNNDIPVTSPSYVVSNNSFSMQQHNLYLDSVQGAIPAAANSCQFCIYWEYNLIKAAKYPDKYKGKCSLKNEFKVPNSNICEDFEWTGRFPNVWSPFNL